MSWLHWLSQITPSEQSLVGEKILILSQLLQHGYPIVPGFVLGSSLLTEFLSNLENSQSWNGNFPESLFNVELDNYQALQSLAQRSQKVIMDNEFPQLWQENILDAVEQLNCSTIIVRPFLFVPDYLQKISPSLLRSRSVSSLVRSQICQTNPTAIVWGIKKIWSELFTAKSIFYWHKLEIELSQVNLALLIQPIQDAQASGTIELDKNCISIRATWGLGHGLDYGAVQPDIYLLNNQKSHLIEQQIGTKTIYYHLKSFQDSLTLGEDYLVIDAVAESLQEAAVLNDAQISSLVQLVTKITSEKPELGYFEWSIPLREQEDDVNDPGESSLAERGDENFLVELPLRVEQTLRVELRKRKPKGKHQFYFHQLDFMPTSQVNQIESLSATASSQLLLTGIAAAPGKITGQVLIYNSETNDLQSRSLRDRDQIAPGSILVTNNIAPSDISLLKNLGGIITETGSLTSHAAILARELGIPAIVNSKNATTILQTGDLVMVDGDQGTVYSSESVTNQEVSSNACNIDNVNNKGIFDYPIGTRLMVNLSQDNMLDELARLPIDGIGLLRAELMLLDLLNYRSIGQWLQEHSQSQIVDYLVKAIKKFAVKFAPRPVFYRSLDIPRSQSSSVTQDFTGGNRGTAAYLQDPTFFDLELLALARLVNEGCSNLNLILPFVRNLEEFIFCRDRFLTYGIANTNSCQLWIMAEVPSVIFLLPEYIKAGVQGVLIGTGDLTRLLFGLEREQIDLNRYYNDTALHNAIAQIISLTKNHQIPCSICLHGIDINPDLIDKLISWGITNITVEPQAIRQTYRVISRAEQRLLLAEITRQA
ncbi:MAG: PEP/pyruvate-binding domain-containing protein [Xenococcus sp. MO_188.B8]|nr:PEP/pyruvate-binding domain-containing protein [Xenococcus sp. MO_188.B8]